MKNHKRRLRELTIRQKFYRMELILVESKVKTVTISCEGAFAGFVR